MVNIDRQKEKEYYKTQKEAYWKVSRKLVGSDFKQKVIDNAKDDQMVFYYSNHCQSCKMYGPLYEEIAREKIFEDLNKDSHTFKGVTFNRINNGLNNLAEIPSFDYTPVFAFYKKGGGAVPFVMNT